MTVLLVYIMLIMSLHAIPCNNGSLHVRAPCLTGAECVLSADDGGKWVILRRWVLVVDTPKYPKITLFWAILVYTGVHRP